MLRPNHTLLTLTLLTLTLLTLTLLCATSAAVAQVPPVEPALIGQQSPFDDLERASNHLIEQNAVLQRHVLPADTYWGLAGRTLGPGAVFAQPDASPEDPPIWQATGAFGGRGCRSDSIAISVPVGRTLPDVDMATLVNGIADGLAGFDDNAFEARVDRVEASRVLASSANHWILTFLQDDQGEQKRVRIRPQLACALVSEVRTLAEQAEGHTVAQALSIARECDTFSQSDPGAVEDVWAGMGVVDAAAGAVETAPVDAAIQPDGPWQFVHPVTVSVVDGPMTDAGMRWSGALRTYDPIEVTYPHADVMARLIRREAPEATIRAYQGLHEGPVGAPISALASTLERALSDAIDERNTQGKIQIINLSLGWPSEMGRPTELRGEACEVIEDPLGEAVRELLVRAAQAGITVVAAAGNRRGPQPLDPYGRVANPQGVGTDFGILKSTSSYRARSFPCAGDDDTIEPSYGEMFYPAAWSRVPTCVDGQLRRLPIVAVGAAPEAAEPTLGEAELFAPGIRHPIGPVPSALADRLPTQMTGTSVAAAITSGLLAQRMNEEGMFLDVHAVMGPQTCAGYPGAYFFRGCPSGAPRLAQPRRGITRVSNTGVDLPLITQAVPMLDTYVGINGPQPPIDICGDDCRLVMLRDGSGTLELRMKLESKQQRVPTAQLEFRGKDGRVIARQGLKQGAVDAINAQMTSSGAVKLDVTDIAIPAGVDGAAVTLAFEFGEDDESGTATKATVIRRSPIERVTFLGF